MPPFASKILYAKKLLPAKLTLEYAALFMVMLASLVDAETMSVAVISKMNETQVNNLIATFFIADFCLLKIIFRRAHDASRR